MFFWGYPVFLTHHRHFFLPFYKRHFQQIPGFFDVFVCCSSSFGEFIFFKVVFRCPCGVVVFVCVYSSLVVCIFCLSCVWVVGWCLVTVHISLFDSIALAIAIGHEGKSPTNTTFPCCFVVWQSRTWFVEDKYLMISQETLKPASCFITFNL